MLHNPNWDQPSLAGFRTWLLQQPQNKTFSYGCCEVCAVGQYMKSIGKNWYYNEGKPANNLNTYAWKAFCAAQDLGRSVMFGDVVKVINESLVW